MAGINGSMAHLSDSLFTTAIATYVVAMVGYVAEYAFGRVARVAPAATPAQRRELVGAGVGSGFSPPPIEMITPPASPPVLRSSEPGSFADRAGRFAVVVTLLGLLFHIASIVVRAVAVDAVPWSNMYEFASVAGLVAVIAFTGVMVRLPQLRHLGGFILLPVVLIMFLAGTVLYSRAQPLVPALRSYWLAIHVTLVSIAEGALMTSAALTILYLIKSRHERRSGRPGYRQGTLGNLAERLPAAASLDKAAYRIVAFSFPLYTVAIICGAIWAEAAWGRYWGWDPKETWAFIVWVLYAAYLHARATAGWKGGAAAAVNLLGFGAITFNFFVINILVTGFHSYAGLS